MYVVSSAGEKVLLVTRGHSYDFAFYAQRAVEVYSPADGTLESSYAAAPATGVTVDRLFEMIRSGERAYDVVVVGRVEALTAGNPLFAGRGEEFARWWNAVDAIDPLAVRLNAWGDSFELTHGWWIVWRGRDRDGP